MTGATQAMNRMKQTVQEAVGVGMVVLPEHDACELDRQ